MSSFGSYLKDKNVYEYCEEPLFLQSEYYNIYIQKELEDLGDRLNLKEILVISAHEIAYSQFHKHFKENEKFKVDERKRIVEAYFAHCGFGRLDLKSIQSKGGHIEIFNEHYAEAWVKHFGKRDEQKSGVGYFAMGFLCGIVEAIFDTTPGMFDAKQLKCISKGDEFSRFEIFRGFKRKINHSPSMGKSPILNNAALETATSIATSLSTLENADEINEFGKLDWFNTTFTKHYVNYFALVEIKLLMQASKKLGSSGVKQVKKLLSKVGEENAYFTFGKILNSEFWQKLLSENEELNSASGLVNCLRLMGALGYGNWEAKETSIADQYKVVIHNCPRTNAFLKLVGNTKSPIGFVNGGIMVGIANFLKNGTGNVENIDIEYVKNLADSNQYEYAEETSRMTGADEDTLIVSQT